MQPLSCAGYNQGGFYQGQGQSYGQQGFNQGQAPQYDMGGNGVLLPVLGSVMNPACRPSCALPQRDQENTHTHMQEMSCWAGRGKQASRSRSVMRRLPRLSGPARRELQPCASISTAGM